MSDSPADRLRPIERRLHKLTEGGAGDVELAWMFQRTPRTVRNIRSWSDLRRAGRRPSVGGVLRPIERCVLRWRDEGAELDDLAARFRRRPSSIAQIERLARFKLAR
jgi:hypothetical protein